MTFLNKLVHYQQTTTDLKLLYIGLFIPLSKDMRQMCETFNYIARPNTSILYLNYIPQHFDSIKKHLATNEYLYSKN